MTGTLLTTLDVAERLGLSSAAIAQAVRTGALQPAARTNHDFLFTERAVADFAKLQAEVAAAPLEPPAASSRSEWSGEVDRLNLWLKDLTDVMRLSVPDVPSEASPPRPSSGEVPATAPVSARSILERIAARHPAPAALVDDPAVADPIPTVPGGVPVGPAEQVPATPVPPAPLETVPASPAPVPLPVQSPVAGSDGAPAREEEKPPNGPGPDLSRQAVLVVQPIVRFRVLREVTERLAGISGIADARLERLEGGVASYRVSFAGERPSGDAIGEALAHLNLGVILVDSSL